jgi:hypothetical protein
LEAASWAYGEKVKGQQDHFQLRNQKCPACHCDIMVTFKKPGYGTPTIVNFHCTQCDSKFQYKISKKALVNQHGDELPLTVVLKVTEMSDKGLHAYQMRKLNEKNAEPPVKKNPADRMGGSE